MVGLCRKTLDSTNTDMGNMVSNQGSKIRLGCGSNLNDGPPAFVCDFDFVCLVYRNIVNVSV